MPNIQKIENSINPNLKAGLITTAAIGIPIALAVIFGVCALHGFFGSHLSHFVQNKVITFLGQNPAFLPNWSLILVGAAGASGILFLITRKVCHSPSSPSQPEEITEKKTDIRDILPSWAPLWMFSKTGLLGDKHFEYYLNNVFSGTPEQKDALILWSFLHPKFQSRGTTVDTCRGPKKAKILKDEGFDSLYIDDEGFAISTSSHSPDKADMKLDIYDAVYRCSSYKTLGPDGYTVTLGICDDGKHVIHQPGVRSCVFSSATMVLVDMGVQVNITTLYHTNFVNDGALNNFLGKVGYTFETIPDTQAAQQWIEEGKGSILLSCSSTQFGSHEIVVDKINAEQVTIREPAFGWRVVLSRENFEKHFKPDKYKGIKPLT